MCCGWCKWWLLPVVHDGGGNGARVSLSASDTESTSSRFREARSERSKSIPLLINV